MRYKNISIAGSQKLFEKPIIKNARVFKNNKHLWHVPRETISYLPRKTSKTEISEGEIPLIRDACPIVAGCKRDNFCLASVEREERLR